MVKKEETRRKEKEKATIGYILTGASGKKKKKTDQ